MELEVTWGRTIKVWWAYFWRSLVAGFFALLFSGLLGFVLGIVLYGAGIPAEDGRIYGGILGGVVGVLFSIIPMKYILGKDFGDFRLVLLKKEERTLAPQSEPQPAE
jgi:hypothetical protein